MKNMNKKGLSLIELIVVMVMIGILGVVMMTGASKLQGVTVCNDYQHLITATKDSSKLPAQFKDANVKLDKDNSDSQTCAFNVSKSNNATLAITIPVEQATKDVKNNSISAIKPAEEDSSSGLFSFVMIILGIIIIGGLISMASDTDNSRTTTEKETEDEEKKESEKKFKSLKNKVKREKEKEKENLKSAKKVYI